MANKAAIALVIGLGVVAGTVCFATRVKAAPETPKEFLRIEQVLAASTIAELDVYYNYMNELYITGRIDRTTYDALYQAYVTRFYQLTGFGQ